MSSSVPASDRSDPLYPTGPDGELHKFLFEGLPVRGMLVRLTGAWTELLARRTQDPHPVAVRQLLGEMSAAACLLQANIKFNGALILQLQGDGPVPLAVAEVQADLAVRATAKVRTTPPDAASLAELVDPSGHGRCAITLDPRDRQPGQQPYQGIVPLRDEAQQPLHSLAEALEHYMRRSEQLETRLILAADDRVAAGLLIQRLPVEGQANLGTGTDDDPEQAESFQRIAHLASTLTREELLTLDADTVLRRLFWEEDVRRFEPLQPRFACTCARERVGRMLIGLGRPEVDGIVAERGDVEVGCDFCGAQYRFDAVDVGALFAPSVASSGTLQ